MTRTTWRILGGLLLAAVGVAAAGAEPAPPRVPYIAKGVCPFEGCAYGAWMARSRLTAYKTEGDTSTAAFAIAPHERFQAIRGNVHVVKLGEVRVMRPVRLDAGRVLGKGDRVYVLSYRGESAYDVWHKGHVLTVEAFWEPFVASERPAGVVQAWPEMLWWVLVKSRGGRQGWLRLRNVSPRGFETREEVCMRGC